VKRFRGIGARALPGVVLPILVVTGLALLWGERLRSRSASVDARGGLGVGAASCDPVRLWRPEPKALGRSSRRFSNEATAAASVRPGPPTMRHLDPWRTNRSPFRAPQAPRVTFAVDVGSPIAAAPIVALLPARDGFRAMRFVVASLDGEVRFLDGEGKEQARASLGERIYGSPAVVGDLVYLGVDKGLVYGLRPDDGKIVRKLRLESDKDDADTALLPLGDRLIFAAGPLVYGVKADGTFLFRKRLKRKVYGSAAALRTHAGAVAARAGGDDSTLAGFVVGGQDDAATFFDSSGVVTGTVPLGADADGSPAVGDDGAVFVGTDEPAVWALLPPDPASGAPASVRFHQTLAGAGYVRGALAVARDGTVLVSTYGPAPAVLGLEPLTGREVFRYGVPGTGSREYGIHGSPVETADGTLIFGGPDDRIHALSPAGDPLWTIETGGDVDGTVVPIADGSFVATTSAGRFLRIDDAP
jgi:outer membrane protein assembly factor BamB